MSHQFEVLSTPQQTHSLKRRLVFKVAGFVALAMVVITLAVVYMMRQELGRQAQQMLWESARSSQIQLENRVAYLVEASRRLADNPFMINGLIDTRARQEDLPKLVENFAEGTSLSTLALLDYDGRPVYQAQDWRPEFNQSPELRAALAMGNTAVYMEPGTGQLLIIAPISYYETTQGALVVGFDLVLLVRSHAVRTDSSYLKLFSGGEQVVGVNYNAETDYLTTRLSASEQTPLLARLDLSLEAGFPQQRFDSIEWTILSRFIGIGLLLTLASAMLAAAIGQSIARPILELYRRVRTVPYRACSPLGTGDELDVLASAFDHRTQALKAAQQELEKQRDRFRHEANHDMLTGLPNRFNFDQRLLEYIGRYHTGNSVFAVIFIDLDRFKLINDSLGHSVGDALLQTVAQRLKLEVDGRDRLFRHGGDEFILISEVGGEESRVYELLDRLIQTLSAPVRHGERDLDVNASIGVTFYPQDGLDAQTLVRNADIAMYEAKRKGGGRYKRFDQSMSDKVFNRMETEAGLRRAIENRELVVYYQPQVDMNSGRLTGTEALVRWQHPEKGLVMPGAFIPLIEESRLIVDIGEYVLREACRAQADWFRAGYEPGRVSVNLAGGQLHDPGLDRVIAAVLKETGCRPEWLELEVTEGFIMEDPAASVPMLKRLRDMGISLAIDDFGTGYSSLAYLKRLPVTRLKIDQSFVRNSVMDPDDAVIIEAIIALAGKLKLGLIAEGVETHNQTELLLGLGCDQAQGYLYGRPVPHEQLELMLKSGGGGHQNVL
ncbi:putative bifunctional diguanylate cyclase/phosphodiesterase [Marinobacterium lutimaris]|uniref:cyclic-guanylate-specific phosphodiesterase n=1 Tax=Marinobacterium lutimaris TaxID=568106 RepID=A0A1H5WW90_9GAMM|nr:EAL domain-containing protein [Marinobacterium lutimaris]SEG03678.1 diguanylate cyclase (GGDEF) domain-containing protein [Marinobacterium lutimaris]